MVLGVRSFSKVLIMKEASYLSDSHLAEEEYIKKML